MQGFHCILLIATFLFYSIKISAENGEEEENFHAANSFLDRVSTLHQLSLDIHLQQEILKGSITDSIHFNVSDLAEIDISQILDNLKVDDEILEAEDRFLEWNKFFRKSENFQDANFDFQQIYEVSKKIEDTGVVGRLKNLTLMNGEDENLETDLIKTYDSLIEVKEIVDSSKFSIIPQNNLFDFLFSFEELLKLTISETAVKKIDENMEALKVLPFRTYEISKVKDLKMEVGNQWFKDLFEKRKLEKLKNNWLQPIFVFRRETKFAGSSFFQVLNQEFKVFNFTELSIKFVGCVNSMPKLRHWPATGMIMDFENWKRRDISGLIFEFHSFIETSEYSSETMELLKLKIQEFIPLIDLDDDITLISPDDLKKFEISSKKSINDFGKCIHQNNVNITEASRTIEVARTLRTLISDPQFETNFTKFLVGIPRVQKKMKQVEVKLPRIRSIQKTSEDIQVLINILKTAISFVQLELKILTLEKKFLIDVSPLKKGLREVKEVLKTFNNYSNIKEIKNYGTALRNLIRLRDVNFDVRGISKNSKLLIRPKYAEYALQTLNALANLDLNFTKYNSYLRRAFETFVELEYFLDELLEKPVENFEDRDSPIKDIRAPPINPRGKRRNGSWLYSIIVSIFAVLFAIYSFFEPRDRKLERQELREWLENNSYSNPKEAYLAHETIIRSLILPKETIMDQRDLSYQYLSRRKHRNPEICCNPQTAIHNISPIHANYIIVGGGPQFIATQGPLEQSEIHDDTREDFWELVMRRESQVIVMLCSFEEDGKSACGHYFSERCNSSISIGRYHVETTSLTSFYGIPTPEEIAIRKITISDLENPNETREVTHFHYTEWKSGSIPKNGCKTTHLLLEKVLESTKKPIIVHSSSGTGRTMQFIGLSFISNQITLDNDTSLQGELRYLKSLRWNSFKTIRQSYWLQLAVAYKITVDNGMEMEEFNEMSEMFGETVFDEKIHLELRRQRIDEDKEVIDF